MMMMTIKRVDGRDKKQTTMIENRFERRIKEITSELFASLMSLRYQLL
jgi:hypothetical protein